MTLFKLKIFTLKIAEIDNLIHLVQIYRLPLGLNEIPPWMTLVICLMRSSLPKPVVRKDINSSQVAIFAIEFNPSLCLAN